MLSPKAQVNAWIVEGSWQVDPAQVLAIDAIDYLFHQLIKRQRIFRLPFQKIPKGIYLFGGVGAGKTHLMDVFYAALPKRKKRLHFHAFMRLVQAKLQANVGTKNPIKYIVKNLSESIDVLCLDEFFVHDIADASILEKVLQALYECQVVLVTTSNIHPDMLYMKGLHRKRFIPAIEWLKKHTSIIEVHTKDYRLDLVPSEGTYIYPLTSEHQKTFRDYFHKLAHIDVKENTTIDVLNRPICTKAVTYGVIWFEFQEICRSPRSAHDYLVIASEYHSVFISQVPSLEQVSNDEVLYFIHLIDVLYDRHVNVMILAEVAIDALYQEGKYSFEFARTRSRLKEMGSVTYRHKAHTPSID